MSGVMQGRVARLEARRQTQGGTRQAKLLAAWEAFETEGSPVAAHFDAALRKITADMEHGFDMAELTAAELDAFEAVHVRACIVSPAASAHAAARRGRGAQ